MSSFKSYKIRDGVHLPSEKFKENWDSIFGKKPKKPKKETMLKKTMTDEVEKNIEWVAVDQWYCNDCQTDIDDTVEEMEMHECKKTTKEG